jgi:hypothetical protein
MSCNKRNSQQNKKQRKNQQGGASVLPSEYFGSDSGRYFPAGSTQLNITPSAYGPNIATSHGIMINPTLSGPDLGPTSHSGMQTGGKKTWDFIVNPETGRKVSIRSPTGKKVLAKYLKQTQ